jgi:hypothetical protein
MQSALEYNNYLINQLEQNKHKLTLSEYENSLVLLWENIKKLAINADSFVSKYNLNDNRAYCDLYGRFIQRKRSKEPSGLMVVIEKSVLREYPELKEVSEDVEAICVEEPEPNIGSQEKIEIEEGFVEEVKTDHKADNFEILI